MLDRGDRSRGEASARSRSRVAATSLSTARGTHGSARGPIRRTRARGRRASHSRRRAMKVSSPARRASGRSSASWAGRPCRWARTCCATRWPMGMCARRSRRTTRATACGFWLVRAVNHRRGRLHGFPRSHGGGVRRLPSRPAQPAEPAGGRVPSVPCAPSARPVTPATISAARAMTASTDPRKARGRTTTAPEKPTAALKTPW